jgi:osmotically-inducible protein OsmY
MMRPNMVGPWIYPDARYYYEWYELENLPSDEPTDGDVKAMLVDRLRENPWTKYDEIRVDVKRKVAILSGVVSTSLVKRAAGDDAWDTRGVVDVSNQLEVARDGD